MEYGLWYSFDTTSMLVGTVKQIGQGVLKTAGVLQVVFFLGNNLIAWFNKKHNCVSLSIVEAEYIAAGNSCTRLVWMK